MAQPPPEPSSSQPSNVSDGSLQNVSISILDVNMPPDKLRALESTVRSAGEPLKLLPTTPFSLEFLISTCFFVRNKAAS